MKKIVVEIMFCILLIYVFGLSFNVLPAKADPRTIYVDDDNIAGPWDGTLQNPYQNITSGLAYAINGDIIYVYNGTYYENLIIAKSVFLIGENKHATIIDGNNTGNVIGVAVNNVNITDFTIQNSGPSFTLSGIKIDKSSGHKIERNIINGNSRGVFLFNSSNNVLNNNNISKNKEGVYLVNSSNNIITNNKIASNEFGIVLSSSNNSVIFHNNFISNNQSTSSINSINSWNNNIEGNYWSQYKGKDNDKNGIGDKPYIIDTNNRDNYPLMGVFSDFNVVYENETHHVFTICNSTIPKLQFNETIKMLKFNVMGINNTAGFCRITISQLLVNKPYAVTLDNKQVNATALPSSNATHTFLYFTYIHSTREVRIISKIYYELMEKYNILLAKLHALNTTFNELLKDYDLLNQTYQEVLTDLTKLQTDYNNINETYTELQAVYTSLNQTYNQMKGNYTQLQQDYDSLNKLHTKLLEDYDLLNQTYQEVLTDLTKLQTDYNNLNKTYNQAKANYMQLQNDHYTLSEKYKSLNSTYLQILNTLEIEHSTLLEQYNSLSSEYTNVRVTQQYVLAVIAVITVISSSFGAVYYRRFKEQKKVIDKYKRELDRLSPLDISSVLFKADVERRKAKIETFEQKYGVTLQPRRTLEDVIRSLELKKKTEG